VTDPQSPQDNSENRPEISQSIFSNVNAETIQTGPISQTINNFQPRPRPTGIPQNIPFRGTNHFVGRLEQLDTLHQELQRTDRVAISAVAGMGGIGKTELAVQYARKHLQAYPGGVCWLQVQLGDLEAQIVQYAQVDLGLPVPQMQNEQPLDKQITWCWNHWEPVGPVLIVLDNVTKLSDCHAILLAPPERFRILVTTRERGLDPNFYELPLAILSEEDAVTLLKQMVSPERIESERSTAETLCERLGYLPLALELVGRYLAQDRGLSLAVVATGLEAQGLSSDVLYKNDKNYPLMTAQRGCRAAFELSWQSLAQESQEVARLLSWFAADVLPWSLAEKAMQQIRGEDYSIGAARRQLDNLHLVQAVSTIADALKLHPLLRKFFQGKSPNLAETGIGNERLQEAIAVTMAKISQLIPQTPTLEIIQSFSIFVSHLSEVAQQYAHSLDDENLIWPFVGLGRFYEGQGLYGLAEPWFELCLEVIRERFGGEHPDVASSLNSLASLYQSQGRYSEAEPLLVKALEMHKQLLGDEHPNMASSLNNLAYLYNSQGRYSEAEPLYVEALKMRKQLLGDEHPDVANSLNNLASLYDSQGRYSEAGPLYVKALEMRKQLLGDEHPDVASSLNNLASLYESQGRYSKAEPLLVEALEMHKQLLGDEHPNMANSLNNLAYLYKSQGRYSEAEPLYVKALEMRKQLLGDEHPDVANSLNNLASLYESQGRYSKAEPLLVEALEMHKQLLGDEHPNMASSLNNLAYLYNSQGRYSEAEPLYVKALAMYERLLGDEHPSVASSLNNLASLYNSQGRYSEAEPLYVEASAMSKRLLGDEHPLTLTIAENLEICRTSEAEPF
jgi:tetratricopeptide (TPR) repeat protein